MTQNHGEGNYFSSNTEITVGTETAILVDERGVREYKLWGMDGRKQLSGVVVNLDPRQEQYVKGLVKAKDGNGLIAPPHPALWLGKTGNAKFRPFKGGWVVETDFIRTTLWKKNGVWNGKLEPGILPRPQRASKIKAFDVVSVREGKGMLFVSETDMVVYDGREKLSPLEESLRGLRDMKGVVVVVDPDLDKDYDGPTSVKEMAYTAIPPKVRKLPKVSANGRKVVSAYLDEGGSCEICMAFRVVRLKKEGDAWNVQVFVVRNYKWVELTRK